MASENVSLEVNYEQVVSNLTSMKSRLKTGVEMVTSTMAKKMEQWAKDEARWKDRTGNARQTLKGRHYWEDANIIVAEISHGVEYGIWLELAHNKKYAILEDTIEAHKDEILQAWGKVISGNA